MQFTLELQKRIMTGILGASLLLLLIFFGGWFGVFLLVAVISIGMAFELSKIIYSMSDRGEKKYLLLSVSWFMMMANVLFPSFEYLVLIFSFLGLFIFFLFTAKNHLEDQLSQHFKELALTLFALIYIVLLPPFLLQIYQATYGVQWLILFLFIVWSGDTAAYFVGKRFGKTKLYPQMSPKKTVEGALGGLSASLIIALLYKILFFKTVGVGAVLLTACAVGTIAQLGDLCESFFKRAFQKKDSGSILPGHGGFLDRFDGILFGLPLMYVCVRIFG